MAGHEAKKVLVTRAQPAADRTAEKLSNADFEAVIFPLFEVADTGVANPDTAFDAYLFTSSNAAEILQRRGWVCPDRDVPAFCVGDQTASAAEVLGFSNVVSAQGTAYALANTIKNAFSGKGRRICYFAGKERTFDMDEALRETDISLITVEIYHIIQIFPPKDRVRSVIEVLGDGLVMLYSPKTAEHVCEVLFGETGDSEQKRFSAVAISAKTRDAVLKYPWGRVYVSAKPNEQSMIRQLTDISLA